MTVPATQRGAAAGGEPQAGPPPSILDPAGPRPVRRPRLVALDLDGTCLDEEQRLAPRVRDAVRATVAGGTPVVVASGRMYRSALPWARVLHVRAPLICYQGAVVRDLPREGDPVVDGVPMGELLLDLGLDGATAAAGVRRAREDGWHRQAYIDDRMLCEEDRPEAHLYAGIADVAVHVVDDLEAAVANGSTKLVFVVDDQEQASRCEDAMRAALAPAARVTRSLPPFIEAINPSAGKGAALAVICERLGVDLADCVAVGDAPNDTDMLDAAGFAVAVAGSAERVWRHADALCAPPEEGGVADVLEVLGLC